MNQIYKTPRDYVVQEFQSKVILTPFKKGWEKHTLLDYIPAKSPKFKGKQEEHVDMYLKLYLDNCFNYLRIKISHKSKKTLGEIVEYIVAQMAKRSRYGNKW